MHIKERIEGNVAILTFHGPLHSEPDAILLRETVGRYIEKNIIHVVLDMGELKYLNSWGLGLLAALLSMLRKAGGDLRLARMLGNVQNLFIVTQLTKVFKSYDDVQSAVESFTLPK